MAKNVTDSLCRPRIVMIGALASKDLLLLISRHGANVASAFLLNRARRQKDLEPGVPNDIALEFESGWIALPSFQKSR